MSVQPAPDRDDRGDELGVDGGVLPASHDSSANGSVGCTPPAWSCRQSTSPRSSTCRPAEHGTGRRAARGRGQVAGGAGADLLLICTNTMHRVADRIEAAVSIPLVNLGDATAAAVHKAGIRPVGLLGTAFTMEQDFYLDRLARQGSRARTPTGRARRGPPRVYEELCLGRALPSSRQAYQEIIAVLVAAGAQGVILGCTEIELLVRPEDSTVPLFPTARLHVDAAVTRSPGSLMGRQAVVPAAQRTSVVTPRFDTAGREVSHDRVMSRRWLVLETDLGTPITEQGDGK